MMMNIVRLLTRVSLLGLVLLPSALILPSQGVFAAECSIFSLNDCDAKTRVDYCNSTDPNSSKYCSLESGQKIVANGITDLKTDMKFSDYIQLVVQYLLGFIGIIGVAYIIYAGFNVLTSAGDDSKTKQAKGTIVSVALGLLLIWLAWAIVTFIIGRGGQGGLVNPPNKTGFEIIPTTYAEDAIDSAIVGTFDEYRERVDRMVSTLDREYKIDSRIKENTLLQLRTLVTASMKTFPDAENTFNSNIANNVITAIDIVRKYPDSDSSITDLAVALRNYMKEENLHIGRITGKASASPQSGNAPFTTSLRADNVRDPSGVVIPSGKYVWWMKSSNGTKQILGTGPSISHTFNEERNYTVFLDVTSASRNSNQKIDVLPLRTSVDVTVNPKLANVIVFVNGANVSTLDTYKITPVIGRAGVVFDATSSRAMGGAKIVRTQWDFGNGIVSSYDTAPRLERQLYVNNGVYKVRLTLTTNEKQVITKEFDLQVLDPIAGIRVDKYEGFANEDFRFQPALNIGNIPLAYEWTVIDPETSKVLYTAKSPLATYRFPRMGQYLVKLKTTTPSGNQDTDTVSITINSHDPIGAFEVKSISSETPNTFVFDATKSYDPDSQDTARLSFAWNVDGNRIELANSSRNGAFGNYTFTTLGTHKVTLEVTNEQGKMVSVKKDVEVNSLLAVKLSATPKIAPAGSAITLIAESKEANVFEWDFGDGVTDTSSDSRISHVFKKSGKFNVHLTVRGANSGGSNSISRSVYVQDANSPYALMNFKADSNGIIPTPDACDGNEAYIVDRVKSITLGADDSVNVDGTPNGLTYTWKYAGKTSTQKSFSYKFDELGCFPVMLTVRSEKTGKTHSTTSYIRVDNLSPTFSGLAVSAEKLESDPVVVTVTANNARDEDGVIVSYLWYYYTDSDPEPQDFRITRANKTTFVLPRINGKYYFALTLEDSNGAKVNSDEDKQDRASITLASDNINTPLVTLKVSNANAGVGQEIAFNASVKNVLQQDITDKVEYKWDYDGDGFYDDTTTTASVKHTYDKPGSFNMKVKASYKGISNVKYQVVNVRNDLRPSIEYFAIGKKFVFLNTTTGNATSVKWKLSNGVTSEAKDSFTYSFDEDEEISSLTLEVSDGKDTKTATIELRKDIVNAAKLKRSDEKLVVFSYPAMDNDTIHLTKSGDRAFLYLGESKGNPASYVIDNDIRVDSDLNGEGKDDADNKGTDSYTKGSAFRLLDSSSKERTVRITTLDSAGKAIATKDIKVVLDYLSPDSSSSVDTSKVPTDISEIDKINIEKLKELIRSKASEEDRLKMMQYVSSLQDNWFDSREKTKIIIDFESYLAGLTLDQGTKDQFITLLDGFLMSDTQTKDDVALAVNVLKSLIPTSSSYYKDVVGEDGKSGMIGEILSHPTNTELNKELGKKILKFIETDTAIDNKDKVMIKSQLETIIYGGQANVPANQEIVKAEATSSGFSIIDFIVGTMKVVGILLGLSLGGVILIFLYFKVSNRNDALSFQDFIIERIFRRSNNGDQDGGYGTPKPQAPVVDPLAWMAVTEESPAPVVYTSSEPTDTEINSAEVPSWLRAAQSNAPVPSEEVNTEVSVTDDEISAETSSSSEEVIPVASEETPSWLTESAQSTPQETIAEIPEEVALVVETEQKSESVTSEVTPESATLYSDSEVQEPGLPSWLVQSSTLPVQEESVIEEKISPVEAPEETISTPNFFALQDSSVATEAPSESPVPTDEAETEELPDWLAWVNMNDLQEEINETIEDAPTLVPTPAQEAPVTSSTPAPSDELPDWLRAAAAPSQTIAEETIKEEEMAPMAEGAVIPESKSSPVEEVVTSTEESAPVEPKDKKAAKSHLKKIDPTDESLTVAEEVSIEAIAEVLPTEEVIPDTPKKKVKKEASSTEKAPSGNTEEKEEKEKPKRRTPKKSDDAPILPNAEDLPDWLK